MVHPLNSCLFSYDSYYPLCIMLFQQTVTKAVVTLDKNQRLGDQFQLLVAMERMHLPRMWVERREEFDDPQVRIAGSTNDS